MAIDRKACFQRQLLDISNATDDLDERVTALEEASEQAYTAGAGIEITGETTKTISVDDETVAMVANLAPVAFSGSYNDLSNKPDIPDMTDYVTKTIENEDTGYGINYGLSNNTPQLFGSDDSGNHPCDAMVRVTYDQVHINANDYNHGDDDDTYTGSIDVTDGYVDIEATNGTDTTTLRVAPNGVTVNGSPIGGGGSTLYRHHVCIDAYDSIFRVLCNILVDITSTSNTAITSLDALKTILDSGTGAIASSKGIIASGAIKDGDNVRSIISLRISNNVLKGLYVMPDQYILYNAVDIPSGDGVTVDVADHIYTL